MKMSFYPTQIETDGLQIDSSERCRRLIDKREQVREKIAGLSS